MDSKHHTHNRGYSSTELSTHTVKAGHRVYFVDAKADSHGSRYIAVSECKTSTKGGARDRQRIHIYEEDLPKMISALSSALRDLGYALELSTTDSVAAAPQAIEPELMTLSLDDLFDDEQA